MKLLQQNKKLLLLVLFSPLFLEAVNFTDVFVGARVFVIRLFSPDTVMFSELGDHLAEPCGGQKPTQEEIRGKAALAAEERRRKANEQKLGAMLDEELGGIRSNSIKWVEMENF